MTAFLIVYARVTDPARLHAYAKAAEHLFTSRGAKLAARGSPAVLEGDWPWEGAVVFEWPSREAAERAWHSADYAAVHRLREGAAEFQVVLLGALPSSSPVNA